ncbi:MAG: flagellar hook-length control protein FliK [Caulobacterales bacterium]|jgi:hypothetical protein|nr:flagellar hook-length control protein FliK [Caulobacterales bacterium]
MSSAAEAIMGATPPPPRPAAGRTAASTSNTPSFKDTLAAETPEAPLVSPASEPPTDTQAASDTPTRETTTSEGDAASPDTPAILPTTQPDASAPAIAVQLIAQAGGEPAQAETAESADAAAPVNAAAPDSFGKALAKNEVRETLPAQLAHTQADAQAASTALPPTDASTATSAPTATPPAAPPTIAAPIGSAKAANKSTPAATPAEATEADSSAAVDTAEADTHTRATEGIAETQAPKLGAKDSSVQEKLAAALENDASQPQAKANSDRVAVASPTPDAPAIQSAPDLALPPVGAIDGARATHTTSSLAAVEHAAARTTPAGAQVAREIVRRFDGETTKFEMRLDPPELGRVEVRMEVTRDHKVTAVLAADSPQALTELMRHARELEQTLQSAGLELAENGLSFDLRQGGDDASQAHGDDNPRIASSEPEIEDSAPPARPIGLERWRGVRVDVMA